VETSLETSNPAVVRRRISSPETSSRNPATSRAIKAAASKVTSSRTGSKTSKETNRISNPGQQAKAAIKATDRSRRAADANLTSTTNKAARPWWARLFFVQLRC